jgi:hypothetical protein
MRALRVRREGTRDVMGADAPRGCPVIDRRGVTASV